MKVDAINRQYTQPWLINRTGLSQETKNVFKIGQEIKQIENQTQYIKQYGEAPPTLSYDYKKMLNAY